MSFLFPLPVLSAPVVSNVEPVEGIENLVSSIEYPVFVAIYMWFFREESLGLPAVRIFFTHSAT
jgi:hypothetical protein